MSNDNVKELKRLEKWAETLLASLSPKEAGKLFRRMGMFLRAANKKRITGQTGPDGTRWARRKTRDRRNRGPRARAKMLLGFRKARHMKLTTGSGGLTLGFTGKSAQIARVHHFGLRERLKAGRSSKGALVKFAERQLIGLSQSDRQGLEDMLLDHIEKAGARP